MKKCIIRAVLVLTLFLLEMSAHVQGNEKNGDCSGPRQTLTCPVNATSASTTTDLISGGTIDNLAPPRSSGFTTKLNRRPITEQTIAWANDVLQHAIAGPIAAWTGDSLAQMHIFRAEYGAVTEARSAARIGQVRYANEFPGSDIGAKINNAYADCPANGCHIKLEAGAYAFTHPIVFGTVGKPAWLECDPGITTMTYTPLSGNAITLNWGSYVNNPDHSVSRPGVFGCVLRGSGGPLQTLQLCNRGDTHAPCTGAPVNGCTVSGGKATCYVDNNGGNPSVTLLMSRNRAVISGFTDGSACLNTRFDTPATVTYLSATSFSYATGCSNGSYILGTKPGAAVGTAVGMADGDNCVSQSVVDGVTLEGFDVGFQFNHSATFLNTITHSTINFNNYNIRIEANDVENNRIVYNNLSNALWGVYFDTPVGGGDWYINNNSFDGIINAVLFDTSTATRNFLHIRFTDNHLEDAGAAAVQDMIQINGGVVDLIGNTIVIDQTGTFNEVIKAAAANVVLENNVMHSNATISNLANFVLGSNASLRDNNSSSENLYTASGAGSICVSQTVLPQMQCQYQASTPMSFEMTGGSEVNLNSGGGSSSINLKPGSGGINLGGLVTGYNGINTVKHGVPSEYGSSDLTAQTTNVGPVPIYAVPFGGAGLYRISGIIALTKAAGSSSTLPVVNIAFTQSDSGVVQTINLTATDDRNTTRAFQSFSVVVAAAANTNIQYSTGAYASSGSPAMQYSLHLRVEAL